MLKVQHTHLPTPTPETRSNQFFYFDGDHLKDGRDGLCLDAAQPDRLFRDRDIPGLYGISPSLFLLMLLLLFELLKHYRHYYEYCSCCY